MPFLVYGVLGVIAVTIVIIYVRRHVKAQKRYGILTEKWEKEGYERRAFSEAGAVLWYNREKGVLLCARANTNKFTTIPREKIRSFAVYDDDALLALGVVGEAMQYGDSPDMGKGRKNKSERLLLTVHQVDGVATELALTNQNLHRASREYAEAVRMAERFVAVMLEIKAENESTLGIPVSAVAEERKKDEGAETLEQKLRLLKSLEEKGLISETQYAAAADSLLREI